MHPIHPVGRRRGHLAGTQNEPKDWPSFLENPKIFLAPGSNSNNLPQANKRKKVGKQQSCCCKQTSPTLGHRLRVVVCRRTLSACVSLAHLQSFSLHVALFPMFPWHERLYYSQAPSWCILCLFVWSDKSMLYLLLRCYEINSEGGGDEVDIEWLAVAEWTPKRRCQNCKRMRWLRCLDSTLS